MKTFLKGGFSRTLFWLLGMVAFVSCKEEEVAVSITLKHSSVYVEEYATTVEVGYTARAASSISIFSVPEGWSVELNEARSLLEVTSPAEDAEAFDLTGTVTVTAYSAEGGSSTAYLYVSMLSPIDLRDQQSNCYIITQAERAYTIPVTRKGEQGEAIQPASVKLVWQSPGSLVDGLELLDGELLFQVPGQNGELIPGNALVAAYNTAGEILWTWHLWITDSEPQARGEYMDRNLGSGCADPTDDKTEILRAYGTYYQWGRMTPFVGPYAYNCASSMDAYMYSEGNKKMLYLEYSPTNASMGKTEYAIAHPLTYLLGSEESGYDWHWQHDSSLWSSTEKSLYDPCPKGWRVAKDFADFTIVDDRSGDPEVLAAQFGWRMQVAPQVESFFLGAGRRSWLEGLITNVNALENPQPWIGYYWTSQTSADHLSEAMYFTLDTEDALRSELDTAIPSARANGMQVRCVQE